MLHGDRELERLSEVLRDPCADVDIHVQHRITVGVGSDGTAGVVAYGARWRIYWRIGPFGKRKPRDLRGFREYRYRDSNPGFRRERAAS